MNNTNNSLQIELHVPDFELAKQFYGLLGFKEVWQRKPEAKTGYLVLRNSANCIINFWPGNEEAYRQEYFQQFPKTTKRGYGVEIVIPSQDDLTKLEKKLLDAKVEVIEPLKKQAWGLYDFRCIDPFGFYLRITTPHDITDQKNAID